MNRVLVEWHSRFPDIDPYSFFQESLFNEYAFSDERDMFADVGFDGVMFNWHTFCEIGSPDNEKEILDGNTVNIPSIIRASFSICNSLSDVKRFIKAINYLCN